VLSINLAFAGTSVVENYYTLENYLENNEAPKDVFISIADYDLAQDNFTWPECNMLHKLSLRQNLEIYLNIKSIVWSLLMKLLEWIHTGLMPYTYLRMLYLFQINLPSRQIIGAWDWMREILLCLQGQL
jgi:hypothetical protein